MKTKHTQLSHYRGFTLIELLVVIAIIALIAGIATPLFLSMRTKSEKTECAANLSEIWKCGQSYAGDHGGALPHSGAEDDESTETIDESLGWWMCIVPYLVNTSSLPASIDKMPKLSKTFRCPSDTRVLNLGDKTDACAEVVSFVSWVDMIDDPSGATPINVGRNRPLSGLPWLTDCKTACEINIASKKDYDSYVAPAAERHNESINILYADGAVRSIEEPTYLKVVPAAKK